MPKLDVAHIRKQGQDMVIVPLDDDFDQKTPGQQNAAVNQIQLAAGGADLAGQVVVVWEGSSGRMKFIAPKPWHPFFRSIDLRWVLHNVNKSISW
ncbi:hypothetical protein [Rhizobium mongolense]|uniref:Uncharacterized protein n=1 Tax=Rhizobium mongolense TaxID=57676 RepID=A0A7W6RHZ3_9HYPH|nr:hypothetical protein [Rhizobium mongolense]MBB4272802.1 hypothetical protein [Rhizobium mongolense]